MFPIFSTTIFITPLPHRNRGLANSILPRVNSQKCLMKIQYREFEGPAVIAMGEGVDKNRGCENQTDFLFFSARFSSPIRGPVMIAMCGGRVCGWLSDKNRAKKVKSTFSIFSALFSSPIGGPAMIVMCGGRVCGWLSDENRAEKIKNVGLTFSATIFVTLPPSRS